MTNLGLGSGFRQVLWFPPHWLVMTPTYLAEKLTGSPRVRAFHCTWVGLTLAITQNMGDLIVQFLCTYITVFAFALKKNNVSAIFISIQHICKYRVQKKGKMERKLATGNVY